MAISVGMARVVLVERCSTSIVPVSASSVITSIFSAIMMPRIWPIASLTDRSGTVTRLEKSVPENMLPDLLKLSSHSPAKAAGATVVRASAMAASSL